MLYWTINHIQKFNFIPLVFCEIMWFKESCILIVFRFLVHNARTRFLEICCFCEKYKKTLALCAVVFLWIRLCQNPQNLTLGTCKPSKLSPSELIFKNWDLSFFLLYDVKLHSKKIEKIDDQEILHCRQMEKQTKANC